MKDWKTKLESRTFLLTAGITIFLFVVNIWAIIMLTINPDYGSLYLNLVNNYNSGAFILISAYLAKNFAEDAIPALKKNIKNKPDNEDVV